MIGKAQVPACRYPQALLWMLSLCLVFTPVPLSTRSLVGATMAALLLILSVLVMSCTVISCKSRLLHPEFNCSASVRRAQVQFLRTCQYGGSSARSGQTAVQHLHAEPVPPDESVKVHKGYAFYAAVGGGEGMSAEQAHAELVVGRHFFDSDASRCYQSFQTSSPAIIVIRNPPVENWNSIGNRALIWLMNR